MFFLSWKLNRVFPLLVTAYALSRNRLLFSFFFQPFSTVFFCSSFLFFLSDRALGRCVVDVFSPFFCSSLVYCISPSSSNYVFSIWNLICFYLVRAGVRHEFSYLYVFFFWRGVSLLTGVQVLSVGNNKLFFFNGPPFFPLFPVTGSRANRDYITFFSFG